MCKLAYFPWLPAIAFSLVFHATAQRQPYFDEVPFTTVYSSSTIESGDTTPVDQRAEPKLQSTHEGVSDQPSARQQHQALIDSYSKIRRPSAEIWNAMGIAYQMLFDLKDATRCYMNALKIDSLNPNTLNNLATVQMNRRVQNCGAHLSKSTCRSTRASQLFSKILAPTCLHSMNTKMDPNSTLKRSPSTRTSSIKVLGAQSASQAV
jgi:hypothetical protein